MNNTKKLLLLLFTVAMVVNLQFNTPLTHNMDNGFSIEQLAENIFVPEAYATGGNYFACFEIEDQWCVGQWIGDWWDGYMFWACLENVPNQICL